MRAMYTKPRLPIAILAGVAVALALMATYYLASADSPTSVSSGGGASPPSTAIEVIPEGAGPGRVVATSRRGMRPTFLPPGLRHRHTDREAVGNAQGHIFYVSYYDDSGAPTGPPGGVPSSREVIVNATEGPAPTEADLVTLSTRQPGSKRVSVRGHTGVVMQNGDVVAVKWSENPQLAVFVSIRGIPEDELLRIAEGLVVE